MIKNFFTSAFLSLLFLPFVGCQERPNILWITIEDTSPEFIGCYGNKDASTPYIDQLSEVGVTFTNAFSSGTVCSPSRSTIITGVRTYEMGTGNHRSNYTVPNFIKGFPKYLKDNGYYVTNNAKTDYNLANEKSFIEETWHESSNQASWKNRPNGAPFFAVFNFADCHQSRTMSMPYDWYEKNVLDHLDSSEIISENDFGIPPFYPDNDRIRKQMARVYNSIKLTDNKIGKLLQELRDDGLSENTIIFFYADHGEGIPRGKTNGIDLGYRIPFIIYFPKKYQHLNPWDNKSTTNELITFHDLAPTMLSLTGVAIPEHMKGRPVLGTERKESPDYTILSSDRADNGPDLVRSITDGRYMYSFNFMNHLPAMRYIRYLEIGEITQHLREDFENGQLDSLQASLFLPRPREYFYDTQSDQWETNNLINHPKHQRRIEDFRGKLAQSLITSRDAHFLPEYELKQISANESPYVTRQSDDLLPIREIIEKTMTIRKKGKVEFEVLKNMVLDPHRIVRYWGAVGLMDYESEYFTEEKEKWIQRMLKESYAPTKIYLAAINYRSFRDPEALKILKSFIQGENEELSLMAINHTLYFEDKDPFISTIQKKYKQPNPYKIKASCIDFLDLVGLADNFKQN
jgi:arylsulfatase A-like enzyme